MLRHNLRAGVAVLSVVLLAGLPVPAGAGRFDRNKPHVRVCTIGHIDHGKTTLTAALLAYLETQGLAMAFPYEALVHAPEERERGLIVSTMTVEYETAERHYAHADRPHHDDYVKAFIGGSGEADGAILVVSAADGPMPQTRAQIILAREAGIPAIVVFLNKVDLVDDPELLDLVELEVRELLSQYGYPGERVAVIRGSALRALRQPQDAAATRCIAELLAAMDRDFAPAPRQRDQPLLLPLERVTASGDGVDVIGRIERGTVRCGDTVVLAGGAGGCIATVTRIELFGRAMAHGEAGDLVTLTLADLAGAALQPGMVCAAPGSVHTATRFIADIYWLAREEGGRRTPVVSGYRPQFIIRTATDTGVCTLPEGTAMLLPGDYGEVAVALTTPVVLAPGLHFSVRDGGRTVGVGVVLAVTE